MKIFIDSANIKEIEKWLNYGIVDGVTTNPSILFNDGLHKIDDGVKMLAKLIDPLPLSAEVTVNDINEMVEQGKWLASLASNIVVKIPVENEFGVPCLGVINQLEKSGIKVNATAILSFGQLVLAAKTGATYVSLFAGKIANEGGNYGEVIAESVNWLEYWNFKSQLIVGSIQSAGDFIRAAQVGAHIITVAPQHLMKMADHKYSRNIVYQFMNDAQNSLKMNMKP